MIALLGHARLMERRDVNKTGSLEGIKRRLSKTAGPGPTGGRPRPPAGNLRKAEGHDEEFPVRSPAVARTDDSFGEATHS
jgi:hypothetical protein